LKAGRLSEGRQIVVGCENRLQPWMRQAFLNAVTDQGARATDIQERLPLS
jgi:hypothetical protein